MISQQLPAMTHPMSRHWQQPPTERVLVDDDHALMTTADFDQLLEYSSSIPTGTYPGKMWKRDEQGEWWLGWFSAHPTDPKLLRIHWRRILVV